MALLRLQVMHAHVHQTEISWLPFSLVRIWIGYQRWCHTREGYVRSIVLI
jgi:hypothetical protein